MYPLSVLFEVNLDEEPAFPVKHEEEEERIPIPVAIVLRCAGPVRRLRSVVALSCENIIGHDVYAHCRVTGASLTWAQATASYSLRTLGQVPGAGAGPRDRRGARSGRGRRQRPRQPSQSIPF